MQDRLKRYWLGFCLFVFLFVVIGGGFHLNPGGAFAAALSGTPLVIYAFNRRSGAPLQRECGPTASSGGNTGYLAPEPTRDRPARGSSEGDL